MQKEKTNKNSNFIWSKKLQQSISNQNTAQVFHNSMMLETITNINFLSQVFQSILLAILKFRLNISVLFNEVKTDLHY